MSASAQTFRPRQELARENRRSDRAPIRGQADRELVTILVRTTVVAVHQANITGNYTVLRDLASPALQEKYMAAPERFAETFSCTGAVHT
jgi:hypothetical protein